MSNLSPKVDVWDPMDVARLTSQRTANQTSLLNLEETRRQQQVAAEERAFWAAHPDLALRGGGQPLLSTLGGGGMAPGGGAPGPMTQQAFGPGGAGAMQTIPAAPNLSQFAMGAPQGGAQPVLGGLSPQVDPRLALMQRNPDAACAVMGLQQKMQENNLLMQEKAAGFIGQMLQGANDQASYERSKEQIRRVFPEWAAALPQTYSQDALTPYIKQAVSVKDNATLQLETMKTQAEMAGLWIQGEPAAMVSELRTMGLNPLTATPEQRRQAQTNIQEREAGLKAQEGAEAARIRTAGEKEARLDKTVSEAFGERTTKLYDTTTGQTVDSRMKVRDYEALPQGRVRELSGNQTEQMENVNNSVPIIAQLQGHIDKIYGPGGVLAKMTPEERRLMTSGTPLPDRMAEQFLQKFPELIQVQRFIDGNKSALSRALAGEKGAMSEGDVARAEALLPNLTTALEIWPPQKIGVRLPDTREVAL